jgi:hypothetical protein
MLDDRVPLETAVPPGLERGGYTALQKRMYLYVRKHPAACHCRLSDLLMEVVYTMAH